MSLSALRPAGQAADLLVTVPLHVTVPGTEPKLQEPLHVITHPLLKVKMLDA